MNLSNLFSGSKIFDVSSVKYKKPIDQQLVNKLIDYIQQSLKNLSKQGLHKIMLGMCGAESELLIAHLLKQALAEKVVVIIFDFDDATKTNKLAESCKQLSLEAYLLKRGKEYRNEAQSYYLHTQKELKHFYHRFLNYHLSTQADLMKAGAVGTFDKSDRLTNSSPGGFYGHLTPFYSLYKSELYDLAKFLNIPNHPSCYHDHLYQNTPLPWDKIDPLLYLLTEKQLKVEDISQQLNIDLHWLRQLKNHVNKQLFQTTISQFII